MNVNGVSQAGYPMRGYAAARNVKNSGQSTYNAVQTAQDSGGFVLHISNDNDGEAISAVCGADHSVTVYKPKDFDPSNPVYKVKIWDKDGNSTERMVDISKVDTNNSDYIDMFAYSSHLSASGEYPDAQSAFISGSANQHGMDSRTYSDLFEQKDWFEVLREAMQTQYSANNLEGYLEYKRFMDFLEK